MPETITASEYHADIELPDWRYVLDRLEATFRAGSFEAAARLVVAIAEAAEQAVHHPDIEIRYPDRVHVALTTHETGGTVTSLDVELAATISTVASASGAASEPGRVQALELAIDAVDIDAIRPFWSAVLGYVDRRGSDSDEQVTTIVDPVRVGPPVWFQQMDVPRPGRGRIHVDVTVPHDEAADRINAALAAGGALVSDQFAPSWWVLGDAEGNEACVCTWQDRD